MPFTSLIKRHIFFLAFISFLLSLIFLTYKDYGVAWDEKVFLNVGKYYLVKIFDFLHIATNLSTGGFAPTPYHTLGHGAFYDILVVFVALFFRNFNFETLHLIRALIAVPIFVLVYWIVSKILNKFYALLSLIFLLLSPRFYPDIFYNAIDVPTALFFTLCLAYFIYYSKTKQSLLKSILFGLILAIAINQRLILFYLPILNAVFLFFNKKSLRSFLTSQFLLLTSLFLFLHLTHPYLFTHPVTGLVDIVQLARKYPWNAAVLFEGQFYQAGVNPLPWYYLPKTMLITIPLVVLFLFLLGNIAILLPLLRRPHRNGNVFKFYLLSIFYFPFILNLILKPTLYDSWRHFLFLTVPIVIISVVGFKALLNALLKIKYQISKLKTTTQKSKSLDRNRSFEFLTLTLIFALCTLIFVGLVNTAIQIVRLHPYEYLYYNSLVGGLKRAYSKYETDYLGLSYKDAVLWFNKNVNDPKKQYMIFVEGDPLSSTTYFKPNMVLTTDPLNADYIFTFTRWNFHERHAGKTIYSFQKEGVPLIYVKQVK